MPRPLLDLDENVIANYAKLGASNREIADMMGCDESTIRNRFPALLDKSRSQRKIKLREMQWKLAEKGNLGMLIWLGKNELNQSEKISQHIEADIKTDDKKDERLKEVLSILQSEFKK